MGIILALVAFALCALVYVRMVRRETPEPMEKKRAIIPVVVGVAAPLLSTVLVIIWGLIIRGTLGMPLAGLSDSLVYKSVITSFVGAGFTEEFVKFLLLVLLVKLLKPKNVYEYVLFCVGISVGFTFTEELLYGGNNGPLVALMRMPAFGLHLVFALCMGTNLAIACYNKQNGLGGVGMHRFLGLFLPVLWHTVFDAATADNTALMMQDEVTNTVGILIAFAVVLVSVIMQFVMFRRFRKKADAYCGMQLDLNRREKGAGADSVTGSKKQRLVLLTDEEMQSPVYLQNLRTRYKHVQT